MSDARALLRAKRQEARVTHPLAAYTPSGQLRCLACGTIVRQAFSWEGHVGSKAHRLAAARMREEEHRRQQAAAAAAEEARRMEEEEEAEVQAHGKRKAGDVDEEEEGDATREMTKETKRMRLGAAEGEEDEGRAQNGQHATSKPANGFPADFFSDPSMAPPPASDDEDEEGQGHEDATAPPPAVIDAEWAAFEQQVLSKPDVKEVYEQATVFAEPELVDQTVGMPSQPGEEAGDDEAKPELTEEELRQKKQEDERELIMDRLLDEERAQEEADAKVTMLKHRLDALRKQREARQKVKQTGKSADP